MNLQEFSAQFDVLYNNITSNQAPGLNEYEKSVFLTKAQSQLITEYFNNRVDGVGGGFDGSQKRQYDFSSLIKVASLVEVGQAALSNMKKLDKRSKMYVFPSDYFLSVNELLSDAKYQYAVQPIDYAEYQRLMLKPYAFPVKKAAWRLITNSSYFLSPYGGVQVPSYIRAYDGTSRTYSEAPATGEYAVYSDWISQKTTSELIVKNLKEAAIAPLNPSDAYIFTDITYTVGGVSVHPAIVVGDTTIKCQDLYNGVFGWREIECYSGFNATNGSYKISVELKPTSDEIEEVEGTPVYSTLTDPQVLDIIRNTFALMKEFGKRNPSYFESVSWYQTIETAEKSDSFLHMKAPQDFIGFRHEESGDVVGLSITVSTEKTSFVEIIGRFTEPIDYQIRYVRKLTPIIITDLDSGVGEPLTIDGQSGVSECLLPEECHQEILERAVTLAKIAWQGGTATQAAVQQRRDND